MMAGPMLRATILKIMKQKDGTKNMEPHLLMILMYVIKLYIIIITLGVIHHIILTTIHTIHIILMPTGLPDGRLV
jgi:hypothetical protein